MPVLTISRRWHNPQIEITVNKEGIALQIPLEDFTQAVLQEFGSPTMVLTKAQLATKLSACIDKVVEGIKESSADVM